MKPHNHDNNSETSIRESISNSNFHDNSRKSDTENQIQELRNEKKLQNESMKIQKTRNLSLPEETARTSKQEHSGCRTGIGIYQHHHGNFGRIQKTIRKTATYRTDPLGYVINLTGKSFMYNDF